MALAWLAVAAAACGARAELDEGNGPAPAPSHAPQVAHADGGGDAADESAEGKPIPLPPVRPPMPTVVTTVSPPGAGDGGPH